MNKDEIREAYQNWEIGYDLAMALLTVDGGMTETEADRWLADREDEQ